MFLIILTTFNPRNDVVLQSLTRVFVLINTKYMIVLGDQSEKTLFVFHNIDNFFFLRNKFK